jgi:hypothetical protein
MEIEDYLIALDALAKGCFAQFPNLNPRKFIEDLVNTDKKHIDTLIEFRKDYLSEKEINNALALFPTGVFRCYSTEIERVTAFAICAELTSIVRKLEWRQKCNKYTAEQPLFLGCPTLMTAFRKKQNGVIDDELLDINAFEQKDDSEILQFSGGFAYLEKCLNPAVLNWARTTFAQLPLYIRVDPYYYFSSEPPQRLVESITIPANPTWWKNLAIHNRMKEGAAYLLDDCSPRENSQQWWEKHRLQIVRLEVIAKRNNNGNLSMMVEELQILDEDLLLGRCIHLDSDSALGTAFEDALLNHLDLAINLYEKENVKLRLFDNLALGEKTVDASYRTHILRIERIPFNGLFGFADMFFKSKTLINEWVQDQFR